MAYANRAVTIVWGIIWGLLFFNEKLNAGKIIGAVIVIAGVLLYVTESEEREFTGQDTNEQKEGEENE